MSQDRTFIVYRRKGDRVVPFEARLVKTSSAVRIELLAEVPWPVLYGGHTTWIGEQIEKVRQAIKSERERRAARKVAPAAPASVQSGAL